MKYLHNISVPGIMWNGGTKTQSLGKQFILMENLKSDNG